MKIVGKIFLFIAGIIFLVSGVATLISSFSHIADFTGSAIIYLIVQIVTGFFSIFAGFAGISCLFVATPFRVKRVTGYATVILILSIASLVTATVPSVIEGNSINDVLKGAWACITSLTSSIVYMVGALLLKRSYR